MQRRVVLWLALAALWTGGCVVAHAADPPTGTFIPVIINIYKGAGISQDDARKAVEAANKILKDNNTNMRLVVVKEFKDLTGDGVDDNGAVDWNTQKYNDLTAAGRREIEKLNNKKGIKIDFVKEPKKGATTPGWAFHREPVVCVKDRGSANLTGQTIAHEFGHLMTLSGPYVIDGSTRADNNGHAPPDLPGKPNDPSHNGNLMAPSNRRTGTNLTADQKAEINKQRFVRGKCSTQFRDAYPALKEQQQFGFRNNPSNGSSFLNVGSTTLWSLANQTDLHGQLTLGNLLSGTVDATYGMAFDTDANASTGFNYHGFTGMERALEVHVVGTAGNYTASAFARDLATNSVTPLGTQVITPSDLLTDSASSSPPITAFDQIVFDVNKSDLGLNSLNGTPLPMGVVSLNGSANPFDEYGMTFDLERWQHDATLLTSGNGKPVPGRPYGFSISGLMPSDPFSLFLDDRQVFSGMLDSSGGFSSAFTFPSDLNNNTIHFLTGQDSTGEFAYSITCPAPEASSLLLFGAGALVPLAGAWRRRKKAA